MKPAWHVRGMIGAVVLLGLVGGPLGAPARGAAVVNVGFSVVQLVLALQEQQYREREVLNPLTDQWEVKPPEAPTTPVGELQEARSLLARGQAGKARKIMEKWVKANKDNERYYEGLFLLGDACVETKDYYRAYEHYEQVVENTAGELFRSALAKEKDIALEFLAGKKRIVWRIFRFPAYDEAIQILDRIYQRVPGTRLGEQALLIKANYYYQRGDMDLAQEEYARLAREYPAGRFVQYAMLRSAESAEAAFPGIKFDATPLVESQERYRQLRATFPAYADRADVPQRLNGITELRAEKDLDIARWYQRTKRPSAAEYYYRLVVKDWPDTLAAAEARNRLREMGIQLEPEGAES